VSILLVDYIHLKLCHLKRLLEWLRHGLRSKL
jgi:hypothetical protein